MLISPDLTLLKEWVAGTVIQVEDNPFVVTVISAETEDKNVFFGRLEMFKATRDIRAYKVEDWSDFTQIVKNS